MAKILVTMPDEFLSKVDGLASNEQRTRSELIREALRTYMRKVTVSQSRKAIDNAKILENLLQ
ncbi:MAG: ribbon-helix-helix protein, CopG family [Brachyspira sp.]|jgi:ribbon-helix-helix protein, copG family|nr:ribbon-helix-helix protein, CopG family [Brachyspira sp.]CCY23871.1 putative transcriptional regulator CopG family [Brachyspira sp. CAG:484]